MSSLCDLQIFKNPLHIDLTRKLFFLKSFLSHPKCNLLPILHKLARQCSLSNPQAAMCSSRQKKWKQLRVCRNGQISGDNDGKQRDCLRKVWMADLLDRKVAKLE